MIHKIKKAIDYCALAYLAPDDIYAALKGTISRFSWIDEEKTDTQLFICEDSQQIWVVFRGTEFDNFIDWTANLACDLIRGPFGRIHQGFYQKMLSVNDDIESTLMQDIKSSKPIIFTGHSQGAAIAEQAFIQRKFILPKSEHISCIAIAPPRSMGYGAAVYFGGLYGHLIQHVINNNDIVTRVPTRLMGYSHITNINLNYLDEDGACHHSMSRWAMFLDQVKGNVFDFGELGLDCVKDHDIRNYQKIWNNLLVPA